MGQPVRALLTRLCEGGDVTPISLDAPTAGSVHRSVVGIRHDDLVADLLEGLRDPFTFRGCLDEHAHARPAPEDVRESFARGDVPFLDEPDTPLRNATLRVVLVCVDGSI